MSRLSRIAAVTAGWPMMLSGHGAEAEEHRRLHGLLLLVAVAVGVYLRWQQLPAQWLTDDEWHAVHKILSGAGYRDILLATGVADFSIPQTLLYKWLAATCGIDEVVMRLPMVVAGVLLVGAGGWWSWRSFGGGAGWVFAALLAISPLLINFSRTARPYALTVLLAWVALLALERWRREREGRAAVVFAVAVVLACWLHMAVAPFVLAPLCWVALEDMRKAWLTRNARLLRGVMALGAAVAVGVGTFGLLPMALNRDVLATRMGSDLPTLDTLIGVWYVWLGTGASWLVVICLSFAVIGAWVLVWNRPALTLLALVGGCATLASILLSRPAWVQNALTFGRYLLPLQPLLLLCVALGLVECIRRLVPERARGGVLAALPAALLIGSPTPVLLAAPNNFTLHYWYQFDYRESHNPVRMLLERFPMSPFWERLAAARPGSLRIAVAGHALPSYTLEDVRWQPVHRQWMWNAQRAGYCAGTGLPPGEVPSESGFRLRNAVELGTADSLRRARIDYVVFNKGRHWVGTGIAVPEIGSCIARFKAEHGAPEYEDEEVAAFRLSAKD